MAYGDFFKIIKVGKEKGFSKDLFRELLNSIANTIPAIREAEKWAGWDADEAREVLTEFGSNKWVNGLIPPGIKASNKAIEMIKSKSTKLPEKKLKLKEDTEEEIEDKITKYFAKPKGSFGYAPWWAIAVHLNEHLKYLSKDDIKKLFTFLKTLPKPQAAVYGPDEDETKWYNKVFEMLEPIKSAQKNIDKLKSSSTKLPEKKLKLKENYFFMLKVANSAKKKIRKGNTKLKESVLDEHPYRLGVSIRLTLKQAIEEFFSRYPTNAWSYVDALLEDALKKMTKDDGKILYNFLKKFPPATRHDGLDDQIKHYENVMKQLNPIRHAEQTIAKIKKGATQLPPKTLKLK